MVDVELFEAQRRGGGWATNTTSFRAFVKSIKSRDGERESIRAARKLYQEEEEVEVVMVMEEEEASQVLSSIHTLRALSWQPARVLSCNIVGYISFVHKFI